MTGKDIVNTIIPAFLENGFIVHQYNTYSTSSIYLKLDYGLACGIRIADHPGKKKYNYRFNVIKDYKGDKVIIKDGLVCYFYNFDEIDTLINSVLKEKEEKIKNMVYLTTKHI